MDKKIGLNTKRLLAYLILILALAYAVLLFSIINSWKKRDDPLPVLQAPLPFISVLIPARDEADHIVNCINAILEQRYPVERMEIIVIDDHSRDKTASLVKEIKDKRLRLLQLEPFLRKEKAIIAYKKAALILGVKYAKGDYIITTDADCEAPSGWLNSFASAFQKGREMVLAPVIIRGSNTLLTAFQGLDVAGTMLFTGATVFWHHPLLSNGANFGFSRQLFHILGAYEGNEKQASGDDIFLLQKAVQYDVNCIDFLTGKEALVETQASKTWRTLFWQRLRWAGKTSAYRDFRLIGFQAGIFLFCLLLWGLTFATIFGFYSSFASLGTAWVIKAIADVFYLHYATQKLGRAAWMNSFLAIFFIHSFYIIVIGALAMLPLTISWKGRKIS